LLAILVKYEFGAVLFAVILIVGLANFSLSPPLAQSQIVVAQTETAPVYCVYQQVFLVVKVQVNPEKTEASSSLDVVIRVEYLDGSPVALSPEVGTFLLLGPEGYSYLYQSVSLTPTGTPGEYRTSVTLPSDIPNGTYKLYCVHCRLFDGAGNSAPNSDISSDETVIATDSSIVVIGPATATTTAPPPTGLISPSLLAGLAILVLLVLLLVALLLRSRKKKK
jgi:hypothetical protein